MSGKNWFKDEQQRTAKANPTWTWPLNMVFSIWRIDFTVLTLPKEAGVWVRRHNPELMDKVAWPKAPQCENSIPREKKNSSTTY